jgi:hypothetical protein
MKSTVVLISLIIGVLLNTSLHACSCVKSSIEEKYKESSTVFIGHIVLAKEVADDPRAQKYHSNRYIEATYNVIEVFKGKPDNTGVVTDGVFTGGSCSVGMLPGVDYIIYLYKTNNVSICNGTQFYNTTRDKELIEKLRMLRENTQ